MLQKNRIMLGPKNQIIINRSNNFYCSNVNKRRSQWPRCLWRRSAASRLFRLWVRIPLVHGCLSVVSVVCCQVEVSVMS